MSDLLAELQRLRAQLPIRVPMRVILGGPFNVPILRIHDETDDLFFLSPGAIRELERQKLSDPCVVNESMGITSIFGVPIEDYDFDRHYPIIRRICRDQLETPLRTNIAHPTLIPINRFIP